MASERALLVLLVLTVAAIAMVSAQGDIDHDAIETDDDSNVVSNAVAQAVSNVQSVPNLTNDDCLGCPNTFNPTCYNTCTESCSNSFCEAACGGCWLKQ